VNKARGSNKSYDDGRPAATIYAGAESAELQFVCMSVDVNLFKGVERFGDVGTGEQNGVIGIPAREIQNNYFAPEFLDMDYFSEAGSEYLHVLTIGEGGISICAHPRYYELVKCKPGGSWANIKAALLHPQANGNLERLNVCGVEIFNGFTMERLKNKARQHCYSDYDEICWDEMLMEGKLYWGFAGNDSYFGPGDTFADFSPLGVVYVAVPPSGTATEILDALRHGRFYSSTGVMLAEEPLMVTVKNKKLQIETSASTVVNWTAKVFEHTACGWSLRSQHAPNTRQATFEMPERWKYVRAQCCSVDNPWQRAWLQPITNKEFFQVN
jgi:hypothetical protein